MKQEELKRIIGQIKRYDLVSEFEEVEDVKRWLENLNERQIGNFINLNIDLSNIKFPKDILLNKAFLNHPDFLHRVDMLIASGYNKRLSSAFLISNYFEDAIKLLNNPMIDEKIKSLLDSDYFINSPYYKSDLDLILKVKNPRVLQLLINLADEEDFIKSPFHESDMKFIASLEDISEEKADLLHSYVINDDALNDSWRNENLKVLLNNKYEDGLLFELLTTPDFIEGKYYRTEVEYFLKAASPYNAAALYGHMIKNSSLNFKIFDYTRKFGFKSEHLGSIYLGFCNVDKITDTNYLKELELLTNMNELIVIFVERLMRNKEFITSPNFEFDLKLLESLAAEEQFNLNIFVDVFRVIKFAFNEPTHRKDVMLIRNEARDQNRAFMAMIAINENNLQSINHDYDMLFIKNMDFSTLDDEQIRRIEYIMTNSKYINSPKHKDMLEQALNNNFVSENTDILAYLNELESNPKLLQYEIPKKGSVLRRIRNGFKDEL